CSESSSKRISRLKNRERRPDKKAKRSGGSGPAARPAGSQRPERRSVPPVAKPRSSEPQLPPRPLMERSGERPIERVPVILESTGAGDFHLIDSGNALKLEQYGPYRIVRPEAQALWQPSLASSVWEKVDAIF